MELQESRRPKMGILEWFHLDDREHVHRAIRQMRELGITELRTGISWADSHTPQGDEWLDWLIPTLSEHLNLLPCLLYTPPSIGIAEKTSSPPRDPKQFAWFTRQILERHGEHFDWVELWNEPNNLSEYDVRLDPDYDLFCEMIGGAAREAESFGKKVLLGGISPIDPGWIGQMFEKGLMKDIDAVGIHGFPGSFDFDWKGWDTVVEETRDMIRYYHGDQEIWISEAGYSTWKQDEKWQVATFRDLMEVAVDRIYWYSLNDLDQERPTLDGFHTDDREYHFGMVETNGNEKLLYRLLKEYGADRLDEFVWITTPHISIPDDRRSILITGGAGFIGTNLAHQLLCEGERVTILDNLHRPGVESNLDWLKSTHPDNLDIRVADVRNEFEVNEAVSRAEFIYHLAAQVAVTTSCRQPVHDFSTNARGTLNILEAIRRSAHKPPMLFTSTNKVYGTLAGTQVTPNGQRYKMKESRGVDEQQKLEFQSPYGCSKGAADAYVLDYARLYDLKTVVFRMSCIYGPHQFGTEDQGWLAHFLIRALNGQTITVYGDGKQVRDVLYVGDLVDAFGLVRRNIDDLSGEAYNMGGGYDRSISLNEFIRLIEDMTSQEVDLAYDNWRPGDQRYYVSDTSRFRTKTGWAPNHSIAEGVTRLQEWLIANELVPAARQSVTA